MFNQQAGLRVISMRKLVNQPLFWCWIFVGIWFAHVAITLYMQRWAGLTISLLGTLAALLVATAIYRRRLKNLYPK
jgi:hypothetical protein